MAAVSPYFKGSMTQPNLFRKTPESFFISYRLIKSTYFGMSSRYNCRERTELVISQLTGAVMFVGCGCYISTSNINNKNNAKICIAQTLKTSDALKIGVAIMYLSAKAHA